MTANIGGLGKQIRDELPRRHNTFRVDTILHALSDSDRADLLEAIADETIMVTAIVRVLRRNGHVLSDNAIRNYRKVKYGIGG